MNNCFISIVINNYNYGRFLRDAIDSALGQSIAVAEVVVVDDGSTDNSREILQQYITNDKIAPVLKENGGQASAINVGFQRAQGEYVIFLDADDVLLPNAVEKIVGRVCNADRDVSMLQFRLELMDETGAALGYTIPTCRLRDENEALSNLLHSGWYCTSPTSGLCLSRGFVSKVMPVPPENFRIAADSYFHTLAPLYGRVVDCREVIGRYRIHGRNAWSNSESRRYTRDIEHWILRAQLLGAHAQRVGYRVDPHQILNHNYKLWASRLASLKLAPEQHPIPSDRLPKVVVAGIAAVLREKSLGITRKIALTLWFLAGGVLLTPISALIIEWRHYRARGQFLSRLGHMTRSIRWRRRNA